MPNVENYFCSFTVTKIMVNWIWVQVEGHALASILAVAFERGEKYESVSCSVTSESLQTRGV